MRRIGVVAASLVVAAGGLLSGRVAAAAASCSISATTVAFGSYDVFAARPTDSIGTITYRCTGMGNSGSVTIDLDGGVWGTVSQRRMARFYWLGLEYLPYNLYLDPARTEVWGDGAALSGYGPVDVPNGREVAVTVYGRIPAQQDVSAGMYFDYITVTINF